MGPPKLKRSASSSLSRNYRLEPSLSYSSNRRNSTLTNNGDIMEVEDDEDEEQDPQNLDEEGQDTRQEENHDSLSINSIEREMTLKDRQEVRYLYMPFLDQGIESYQFSPLLYRQ